MPDRFDVIVVGARCAGSPLATLLARQGLRVALLERATFPKDTLSTHIFEASAINFLDRLGVVFFRNFPVSTLSFDFLL